MTDKQPTNGEKPLRVHQSVARELGIQILTGRYKPGDGFVGEIEQSSAMRVSRTAYREALRILVAKGLVESRPKTGTQVTPRSRWNLLDPEILAWTFSSEPDDRFIRDLFELRGIIEPAAAALAAERRTERQISNMRVSLEAMQSLGLACEEGRLADQEFHRLILESADNAALASLASSVGAAVSWTTRFKQRRQALPRDPIPEHVAVYEAILHQDVQAARNQMNRLLHFALEDMGPTP